MGSKPLLWISSTRNILLRRSLGNGQERALVPVLNFAQDGINILGHGELAQSGIGDRYRIWCNLVGEISPSRSVHGHVGFEKRFHCSYPGTKRRIPARRKRHERLWVDIS
jgi:hypothetical protein